MKEKGPRAGKAGALEAGKGKEMDSPPEPPGVQPC